MKNKTLVWVVIVIVAVVIIGAIVHARHKSVSDDAVNETQNSQNGDSLMSTEDVSAGSVHAASGSTAPVLTYDQALAQYATRRIQFDTNCQATPGNATFKNGVTLMLDNRSAGNRTIHMGSFGDISIKAWGFKIVNLTSSMLPNAIAMDCNGSQNVAIITLQK